MTVRTPGTPASKIDRTPASTPGGPKTKEEKIVVTVRLRPLSKKEQLAKDQVAWECVDDRTIVFKPPTQERTAQPAPFTFDKVFGPTCLTETVYEDGVKNVALSALMGINATIFAYGQTSSGKTYTMRGITEKAVNDIYKHIMNTPERDFTIKISGLEIYNENVRDLLNTESGRNLKLLDDPEKGTVVEKLVEETASNDQHLRHLISICEVWEKSGHIPYRDSKLTRICHSLVGMHVLPSYVVSDKQLVKHLQKEVARLEAELRTPDPTKEKDLKIQQMEMEMEELRRQRDLAQSQPGALESPRPSVKKCLSYSDALLPKQDSKDLSRFDRTRKTMLRQSMRQSSTAPFTLVHEIRKLEHLQEQLGEEANRALEVLQKELLVID
ncbi:hypothetical protein GH714_024631 [Hevea brasiliensis]|uniref:Kinesin motor domain-containing protein n=1 Tax=Hevea brasiliensis TaxID=3981 RepID=A0A6A6LDL1_HEVBR|nr:hypothetical protein GH714_024631 [Hevea brasiliensis]